MSVVNQIKAFMLLLLTAFLAHGVSAAAWIEPNVGQSSDEYDYVIRAKGLTALVAGQHVDFLLPVRHQQTRAFDKDASVSASMDDIPRALASHSLRLQLVNARDGAMAKPGKKLRTVSHYFNGSKASQWTSDVPHLAHARIEGVYPGIDVVYRLNEDRLEYDFEVAPGADVSQIQLKLHGAKNISIAENGEWVATTSVGELRQLAPVVFQTVGGRRQAVAGEFTLQGNDVIGFDLDDHNKDHALTIDPIIEFSGYVGGTGEEYGSKLLETPAGNYVLLGTTTSIDFVGTTPDQLQGDIDVFVMELDPTTGIPNWVTILGGSDEDRAENMQLDSAGNIVIVGYSSSDDYPTVNAFQPNYVGSQDPTTASFNWDGTLTKLSADGSNLIFATYIGGADADFDTVGYFGFELLRGIAIDDSDNIYVAGQTSAADFPVTTTIAGRTCMEADINSFVSFTSDIVFAKFTATGTRLMSACIGGSERDGGRQIVLGPNGSVYLAGFGRSGDLPGTTGFFQPQPYAELGYSPFVIKLSTDLASIDFATYVGEGILQEVEIDATGNIYGVGTAFTDLFPVTPGAFQTVFLGDPVSFENSDGFAFKLNADGMSLSYATYLGGAGTDENNALEIDSQGRVYMSGVSGSSGFPLENPLNDTIGPLLGGSEPLVSVATINNLRRRVFFDNNGFFGYLNSIARNGVNQITSSPNIGEIGTLIDVGTSSHDSSDMMIHDLNSDGNTDELLVTNRDAANEFYRWNPTTQVFDLLGTTGLASTDSRGATPLFESIAVPGIIAAVANYGESNQLTGLINGSPFDPVSVDFGRTDGNTTAITSGYIGPGLFGFAIIVANENQDIRLYPYDGGDIVGAAVIISNNPGSVGALEIGDVNGDGENDLVVARLDGPVELHLFTAGLPTQTVTLPETASGNTDVLLSDMDDDGDQDLLVGRTTNDLLFENIGGGTLVLQSEFSVDSQVTNALATSDEVTTGTDIYVATDAGIERTFSGRPSVTLTVLNSTGTDLEFSTFLPGGGEDSHFRGLAFASGSESKVLLAAQTNGSSWPQINSSAGNVGGIDAVYMVLELDQDADSVLDGVDNCLLLANPSQRDTNEDGFGNLCDPDLNNDGVVNFLDISIFAGLFLSADEDADFDGNGSVSFLDLAILRDFFLQPPGPGAGQAAP